jgi:hypothetical protein
MEPISSFVTIAEKITYLNKNNIEILTSINDLVSSTKSSVNIVYDDNGVVSSYSQPTVGYLKNQIDVLNQNMKRMASIDGYTFIRDGQSFKRVMTTDLNIEPQPIGSINQVTTFTPVNNHFFESLMNPILSVTVDLTNKVDANVNKILSRRYIVRFEKNVDGTLTEKGLMSFNSFNTNFLNKSDINISDYLTWYNNPTNNGLVVDTVQPYDEQIYDLKLKTLNYHGIYSVIKVEIDDINNKMWYHLNNIKYYGDDGSVNTLTIGSELLVNRLNAGTRYKVVEVNNDSSNTKVRLENLEGYDPVVVGTDVLKYYSDISANKSVQINVGFDEYIVLFIKPINTDDNILGNLWSKGISFYTNDLLLDINNNINLGNYYVQAVYDYGTLLRDMISKKIPTIYGAIPNPVTLTAENFKVVQINKHLTDDKDQDTLKKLHSEKTSTKTKISQLNTALTQKTSKLNAGGLTTVEKQTYLNEINKLKVDLDVNSKNLSSALAQINEVNVGQSNTVAPKYRVRGFWRFPEPIMTNKTSPQHVVQFRVQYRYSSKSGNSNNVQTFEYVPTVQVSTTSTAGITTTTSVSNNNTNTTGGASIAATSTNLNNNSSSNDKTSTQYVNVGKTVPIESTVVSTTTENPSTLPTYANFSNWTEILTDVRKRYWDENSKQWYWKIEDVENADTPNINQLDIAIQANERVEIRIKAISEVGWPESLLESDWSNVLPVDFPDDLKDVLADNQFILQEASQDQTLVQMETTLTSKGFNKHIDDSIYVNQDYFAHMDKSIQVSIRGDQSSSMNLYQYLTYLTDKITKLEQIISGAKGSLTISLFKKSTFLKTINNNSNITIAIECEDYGTLLSGTTRTYQNSLNVIDDYTVALENTVQSGNLGFLSNRLYVAGGTNSFYTSGNVNNQILMVDWSNNLYPQVDNQFIWFADRDSNEWLSSGVTQSQIGAILNDAKYNLGTTGSTPINISDDTIWTNIGSGYDLMAGVFPYLPDLSSLVENGQDKTKLLKPQSKFTIGLKVFFKFNGSTASTETFNPTVGPPTNTTKTKRIKFWFETTEGTYQFNLIFNLMRYRTFLKPGSNNNSSENV